MNNQHRRHKNNRSNPGPNPDPSKRPDFDPFKPHATYSLVRQLPPEKQSSPKHDSFYNAVYFEVGMLDSINFKPTLTIQTTSELTGQSTKEYNFYLDLISNAAQQIVKDFGDILVPSIMGLGPTINAMAHILNNKATRIHFLLNANWLPQVGSHPAKYANLWHLHIYSDESFKNMFEYA